MSSRTRLRQLTDALRLRVLSVAVEASEGAIAALTLERHWMPSPCRGGSGIQREVEPAPRKASSR
jgi:hypothetical protein